MKMRKAKVFMHGIEAGILSELDNGNYQFEYQNEYSGASISLTMPIENQVYNFELFPPFFEGLLPEGIMLDGLLRQLKIDANDYFSQLMAIGEDLVGAVTLKLMPDE